MTKDESENGTVSVNFKKNQENKTENGGADDGQLETKRSVWQKIKTFIDSCRKFILIEPFLLFYIFPAAISSSTIIKLNLEKACRANLGYDADICTMVITGNTTLNITKEASQSSQILVAEMTAWRQPMQSSIPAILILFLGAWSDKTGNRKALMLAPLIGELISNFFLLFATYNFLEWPLWATGLIEGLPSALSGGLSVALMGAFSFLADVTTEENRTFRMGFVGVLVSLAFPIGTSVSGLLTDAIGYYGIFGLSVAMYLIGFIYTYYRIHDVNRRKTEGTWLKKFIEFFNPKNVWDTISLVIKARGRALAQILLVITAHILILGPIWGEGGVMALYVLNTYHMNYRELSYYISFSTLVGLSGTAVALTLFSKKMKMHDAILGIIATGCKVASMIMFAFAPDKRWLYSIPLIDFFGGTAVPAIRSLGTKVVKPDQVGKICSLIGLCEAIVPVIYVPMYSLLYTKTVATFPGAVYLLGSFMTAPDFLVFTGLYILHRKQQKDVVANPAEKEAHAYENTAL